MRTIHSYWLADSSTAKCEHPRCKALATSKTRVDEPEGKIIYHLYHFYCTEHFNQNFTEDEQVADIMRIIS